MNDHSTSSVFTITILAIVLVWLAILIFSVVNLTRRTDISMPVKVFWGAIIFIAPVLGLIFYLLLGRRKNLR